MRAITSVLLCLAIAANVFAVAVPLSVDGTLVSGTISVDTIWDLAGSPWIITGDITIAIGVTLTIEPGVQVLFDGNFGLWVDGTLNSIGTEINRITITSNSPSPAPGDWNRIQINPAGNIEIKYCDVSYGGTAVWLDSSSDNIIINNSVSSNSIAGIYLYGSSSNNITNNIAFNNVYGIYLSSSNGNTVANNTATNNGWGGILLDTSDSNNISNNNASSNMNMGIYLSGSNSNTIVNNNISSNDFGIYLRSLSIGNAIYKNNITSNTGYGIYIEYIDSLDNSIYHNIIFDNTNQGFDFTNNDNQWDKGYPSGGNYWSDYTGVDNFKGPNQDIPGSDGIGDTPYIIDTDSQDNYPFVEPNGWMRVHNIDKDLWYSTIQSAVDDADSGNTLLTKIGYYFENVVIDKTLTLEGEDRDTTVIDDGGIGDVVSISEDWVNVSGFTIANSDTWYAGVKIDKSNNCRINNCNTSDNWRGIYLDESSNNTIANNKASNNEEGIYLTFSSNYNTIADNNASDNVYGIRLSFSSGNNTVVNNTASGNGNIGILVEVTSSNNKISHNTVLKNDEGISLYSFSEGNVIANNNASSNTYNGIMLSRSSNNTIANNSASDNSNYGIDIGPASSGNTISNNSARNNDLGIYISSSSDSNNITDNNIFMNSNDGIIVYNSLNNVISRNLISNNLYAIGLDSSSGSIIVDNTAWGNVEGIILWDSSNSNIISNNNAMNNAYGITITDSNDNTIYRNNIIDNTIQAFDNNAAFNDWHNPTLLEGNFWSDYLGLDNGAGGRIAGDGIGDTLLEHPGPDFDNFPLMWPTFGGPVHNLDTDEYFDGIQAAINDPDTLAGHEIEVEAGTYTEKIQINKAISLTGSGKTTTIIEGDGTGNVVKITASGGKISGFKIMNGGSGAGDAGIRLSNVENCVVDSNELSGNGNIDILIDSPISPTLPNTISNNDIISSNLVGIMVMQDSKKSVISGNTIQNHDQGIWLLSNSEDNDIIGNVISNNGDWGIYLQDSDLNTISGNTITNNNFYGIWLSSNSDNNDLLNNLDISKHFYGIYLSQSSNNDISGNTIKDNTRGINLELGSTLNNIFTNTAIIRNTYGIYVDNSDDNTIYQNYNINTLTTYGIYILSSNGEIYENIIQYCDTGVKLDNSPGVNIHDNTITDCTITDLDIDPSGAIVENNILRNSTYGIKIDQSYTFIKNNIITGCSYGIYIYYSNPVITDNIFEDNIYAIFIDDGSEPTMNNNTYINNTYNTYFKFWPMDIDPDTLNLKSQGRWITCYLEPSENVDLSTVDISTIMITEIGGLPVMIPAETHPSSIGDEDGNGIPDLMVKFDRSEVEDSAWPGDIEIKVQGELTDGTPFEGYCTIRVIDPGK